MRLLAIETSTWLASVAATDKGEVLAEEEVFTRGQHASVLLPAIRDVLKRAGIGVEELDAVAVSVGPGSFTGLRVGLSVAKALAYARKMPVLGIPTLTVVAHAAPSDAEHIAAALDARKGELYAAVFRRRGTDLEPVVPERLVSFADLVGILPRPCTILGDAVETYGHLFQQHLGPQATVLPFPQWAPRARSVAQLASGELARAQTPLLEPAEPRYLRPPEAQVHLHREK